MSDKILRPDFKFYMQTGKCIIFIMSKKIYIKGQNIVKYL